MMKKDFLRRPLAPTVAMCRESPQPGRTDHAFRCAGTQKEWLDRLPDFHRRLKMVSAHREQNMQYLVIEELNEGADILLSLVPRQRLEKTVEGLPRQNEFLSPGGIRSISKTRAGLFGFY